MDEIEIFLRLAFAGLGLILTGLSLASWWKSREIKVLLAGLGFGTMAALGIMLALGVFSQDIENLNSLVVIIGMNFLAMLFLYLSVLKR